MVYRLSEEKNSDLKLFGKRRTEILSPDEWVDDSRVDEEVWRLRYSYESRIISEICKEKNYKKIIELGSGPGVLGQEILSNNDFDYTYVDKIEAKKSFIKREYKGKFLVKDLMNGFDIKEDIDIDYDLVIANDFLEHISNPSDVMYKATLITKENAGFFISVPNWRMGHTFIYRGLFDYDNFLYFCTTHGWKPVAILDSPLKCQPHPKLSSELTLDDRLINSWNWYIFCEKINED
jgi:2-polyprenyl-3-methyl-5-hydroxy-6-metoxy-1,4-benzoquinol methylase